MDWHPLEAELTLMRVLIPADLVVQSNDYQPTKQLERLTVEVSPNATYDSWQPVGNGTSAAPFATGWTEVNLAATPAHRFVRVRLPTSRKKCALAEVEFHGRSQPIGGTDNCTVIASVMSRSGSVAANMSAVYSYSSNHTPVVSHVSPTYGSAAGGTTITISGSNLPASAADAVIMIDGVNCEVTSANSSSVECVTGARVLIPVRKSFRVTSRSMGYGLAPGGGFMYKDRWSSRVTWAGVVSGTQPLSAPSMLFALPAPVHFGGCD